jgi:hypothetical protein
MDKFLDTYNQPNWTKKILSTYYMQWNWSSSKESPYKEEHKTWWIHSQILPNLSRKTNTNTPHTFPGNTKGRNTNKLILWSQHYTHSKTQ